MSLRWAHARRSRNTLICRAAWGGCASRSTPAVRDRGSLHRPRQKALRDQAAALTNGARQHVEPRRCPEGIQAVNVVRLGMSFRGRHLVAADPVRTLGNANGLSRLGYDRSIRTVCKNPKVVMLVDRSPPLPPVAPCQPFPWLIAPTMRLDKTPVHDASPQTAMLDQPFDRTHSRRTIGAKRSFQLSLLSLDARQAVRRKN